MSQALSIDEKIQLITRNLDEVMGGDVAVAKLREILAVRDLKVYWGTATTGAPHIAYFVPMSKIADFLRAGCEVTILFADLHAYLDNQKAPWELLKHRTDYYEEVIKQMLLSIGVNIGKLKFIRGTEYQLSREYTLDMYKLTTITTERNAKKAGAEVVKQVVSPCLSGMLYPLLQALDEQYLHVDAQFGGVDQRKIFTLAEKCLPCLGYAKRIHLMNPMVPGLAGAKMSSSETNSKIDLLDAPESIQGKIKHAFCEEGKVEGNGVLAFVKMVLFAVSKDGFVIKRKAEWGGDMTFQNYQQLEDAFVAKQVHPLDLKDSVTFALNQLLAPIRAAFQSSEKQELVARAYPKVSANDSVEQTVLLDDDEVETVTKAVEQVAVASSSKPGKAAKPAPQQSALSKSVANAPNDIARLDIKVGRVVKAQKHPHADSLYVEEIDIGEAEPRQVVSGLVKYMPVEDLQNRLVCVLTNLKPTSLVGIKSHAMVLAANSSDGSKVELLDPPANAKVGERVSFDGYPVDASVPELARANENVLKTVMPELTTNAQGVATYKGIAFNTSAGPVTVKSLHNANIK